MAMISADVGDDVWSYWMCPVLNGDADAAVDAGVQKECNKFRQLVSLLTDKDVSLLMRGKLCVKFAKGYF